MNKSDLHKLINAIVEKNVVSIIYENDQNNYSHRIHPYNIFNYGDHSYLLALNENHRDNSITTYMLEKIVSVDITSLYFTEDRRGTKYLDNKFFNPRSIKLVKIEGQSDIQDIISSIHIGSTSEGEIHTKAQRLLEYYIKCLKNESLLDIKIDFSERENYYFIDDAQADSLIYDHNCELRMDSKISSVFNNWSKKIKYEPDLVLYLGYPYFKVNSSYVPLAYYQALYNPDTNTLKILTNSLGINGAFLSDDMELSAEEALDIMDKMKSFMYEKTKDKTFVEQLNHYFSDILLRHPLVNAGILFLETNVGAARKLIKELKAYQNIDERKYTTPFKSLVEAKDISSKFHMEDVIYNVLNINDSQRKVIRNSNRDILLVQGPPGTGKTQTIINIIANEVIRGNNVLVASVNNKAVDNIIDKMMHSGIFQGILRLGNQEYREKATKEVCGVLQNEYSQLPSDLISDQKTTSLRLKVEIDENYKTLEEISALEEKKVELQKAYDTQLDEINSRKIDIKNIVDLFEESTDIPQVRYLRIIRYLQFVSLLCTQWEEHRSFWFWSILNKLGFNYDGYAIKRTFKKLHRIGINTNQLPFKG